MVLASSQFFFLKNTSLSRVAMSCGLVGKRLVSPQQLKQSPPWRLSDQSAYSNLSRMTSARIGSMSGSFKPRSFSTFQNLAWKRPFGSIRVRLNSTAASSAIAASPAPKAGKRHLMNSSKYVGYWLIGTAGLVFGIVILGGLTRLTESGLSITEWKPVTGSLPPRSESDWLAEFEKYKESPEFKILNTNITLEEYKFIYYMEWAHRLWGRAIGLVIAIPTVYFIYARKTSPHTTGRLLLITGLLGLQGFIGWWMVKSGLNDKFLTEPGAHPRVSQYRLATHLGAAFLLYVAMLNTGLDVVRESKWIKNPAKALAEFDTLNNPILKPLRRNVFLLSLLVFTTAMSGAFVAGLDAGLIYNTFPMMGDGLTPSVGELFDPVYASKAADSWNLFWKNMLENPATVQLNHRILATTTFFATLAVHMQALKIKHFLPPGGRAANGAMMGFVSLQVTLGFFTLIYVVPTELAAAHQAGALGLLTSVLVLLARLRLPRTNIKLLVNALAKNYKAKSK